MALNSFCLNVAISDTAAHAGSWVDIGGENYVGLHLSTTGTLVGNWKVEVSNNVKLGKSSGADITVSFSPSIAAVASSPNDQFAQLLPVIAQHMRVTFTASSGAGNALAALCGKAAIS